MRKCLLISNCFNYSNNTNLISNLITLKCVDYLSPILQKELPVQYLRRMALEYYQAYQDCGNELNHMFISISILCVGRRIIDFNNVGEVEYLRLLKLFSGRTVTLHTLVSGKSFVDLACGTKILKSRLKLKRFSDQEFKKCIDRLMRDNSYSFFSIFRQFCYKINGSFAHTQGLPLLEIKSIANSINCTLDICI